MTAMPLGSALTRRVVQSEDTPFLQRLYASTRAEEMAYFPWTDTQKEAFLQQQFVARQAYYQAQFADALHEVLLLNGVLIGSLSVLRRPGEIHLLDIALLPEYRNRGLGTALLRTLIAEADVSCVPLHLHVEAHNPAARLYSRLGFQTVSTDSLYTRKEYRPVGIDNFPTISYTQSRG